MKYFELNVNVNNYIAFQVALMAKSANRQICNLGLKIVRDCPG